MNEQTFLSALHESPNDEVTWAALADWLEEDGQPQRAELVRIGRRLRSMPVMKRTKPRARLEDRLIALLAAGVRPVVPEIVNSIGMRLALITPGRFRMGSPANEERREPDEQAHEVEITRPFYLGVYAVTQGQYLAVMKRNPSHFCSKGQGELKVVGLDTSDFPVEQTSWQDACDFCRRLTKKEGKSRRDRAYRLPTEAEWEYACRAGTTTPFHFGSEISLELATYDAATNYGGTFARYNADRTFGGHTGEPLKRPAVVGSYLPNAFGLYDCHGNVWNVCLDGRREYSSNRMADPRGPLDGDHSMVRGGGWDSWPSGCRSAYRCVYARGTRSLHVGFRVAVAAET
jgi:uncharacterized protein (TIGR02996 family)